MSSKGGYTAAPPRQGADRFYNAPPARRYHQTLVQQQQQVMQRQLLQQQQQQQHQRLVQRRASMKKESSSEGEAEKRIDVDDSAVAAPLFVPRSSGSAVASNVTNLDRLMESVTPFIQARYSSEGHAKRSCESDSHPFFYLEDLWESFNEWSAYGAGVPLLLNGKDPIQQYYVPFLSGMQLYVEPPKRSSCLRPLSEDSYFRSSRLASSVGSIASEGDKRSASILNSNMQRMNRRTLGDKSGTSSSNSEADISKSPGFLLFQFLEHEQPYNRRPLTDKISVLVSKSPELSKYKSCDLLPSSWICVAWYPIYRIPIGPTLQDLDASFLTFHSLSTQPRSNWPHQFHAASTRTVCGVVDPTAKISLPVFALASYKLKGSIVSPCGPHECEQETALLQSADTWLHHLQVVLPDYQFFRAHYSPWR